MYSVSIFVPPEHGAQQPCSSRRGGVGERLAFLHAHIRRVGVCRFAADALGIVRHVGDTVQRHEMEITIVSAVVGVHTEETRCPRSYDAIELL